VEDQTEVEAMVTEYFNEIGLKSHLKLSDGRRVQIVGEADSSNESEAEAEELYTKEEIKGFLRDMINHKEYYSQRSAIDFLLNIMDNKTVDECNTFYLYIKNKEILKYLKTG
jgi:hypothetical protein